MSRASRIILIATGVLTLPMLTVGIVPWLVCWAVLAFLLLLPLGLFRFGKDVVRASGPKAPRQAAARTAASTKQQGAAQAKRDFDDAKALAHLIENPKQRAAFLAQEEARFRKRLQAIIDNATG